MFNSFFKSSIEIFLQKTDNDIIGEITTNFQFDLTQLQINAWIAQIPILKIALQGYKGTIFFEFPIPRMGSRVDSIVIIKDIVFVIEFKVGENKFNRNDIEQVWDYALDLKNFHETSHKLPMAPILIAPDATWSDHKTVTTTHNDNLLLPIKTNAKNLAFAINSIIKYFHRESELSGDNYSSGRYSPTPTIIEAAVSLYNSHAVEDITRNDAGAKNLTETTSAISEIIKSAKENKKKIICFVTGVPGAGKTLVGLKVATEHLSKEMGNKSVYLSGNAPLVAILQEALARDKVKSEFIKGNKITKKTTKQAVKSFIQIIHHYRDEYLKDKSAPYDHIAIFDEAQRAWNKEQTVKFMRQKKGEMNFDLSEPEFLISCLDRHKDWAVIVCLVGGGQEINTGEAGISEWLHAIKEKFTNWDVYISPNLNDSEYSAVDSIENLEKICSVNYNKNLHLGVSMRSYRAENLSLFVKNLLDLKSEKAKEILSIINEKYPIVLTRDLPKAKNWLHEKARGSERYGLLVSSEAQRLKPMAIDVKSPMNPVNWFLNDKDDVRSSYFLEDVATEFSVQGLELDWSCVTWDGDLRYSYDGWKTFSFVGRKWQNIHKLERKKYLINAYRVLLTRARQGMIIVVPEGNVDDHTRIPEYYDTTFRYLSNIGITVI
ncbi:MAG: DUF2075 domain-containing protein [Bacteroidota bacterium]|nr:DUF2075 domain-containing protein [Bacteroidota bacterium]